MYVPAKYICRAQLFFQQLYNIFTSGDYLSSVGNNVVTCNVESTILTNLAWCVSFLKQDRKKVKTDYL